MTDTMEIDDLFVSADDAVTEKKIRKGYNRVYYLKNKEKISQKIVCGCGLVYQKTNKSNHCEGRVHKLWDRMVKENTIII
jgi:hypothetical protein